MKRRLIVSALVCTYLFGIGLHAQTAVTPMVNAKVQFSDANGRPLAGGFLHTYISGTTTPQATYSESTGTTANTNPVVLDSAGYATVFVSAATYKFVLDDADGNQQWSIDGIKGAGVQPFLIMQEIECTANPYVTLLSVAGADTICPDATAHRPFMQNNGGGLDPIVGQNTTDTLLHKTLVSPNLNTNVGITGTVTGAANYVNPVLTNPTMNGTVAGTPVFNGITVNTPVITRPTINAGVFSGSGLKHQRFSGLCVTGATAGDTCTTTLSWSVPFADNFYTIVCTGFTAQNNPIGPSVENVTAIGFDYRIYTGDNVISAFSSVECIAIHD
jgi:hypothetical protein